MLKAASDGDSTTRDNTTPSEANAFDIVIPACLLGRETTRVLEAAEEHRRQIEKTRRSGWSTRCAPVPRQQSFVDGDIETGSMSQDGDALAQGNVCEFLLSRGVLEPNIGFLSSLNSCDSPSLALKLLRVAQRLLFRRPATQVSCLLLLVL
jgi:hypothetical protein